MMEEYQFPAPERTLKQKKERRKEFLIKDPRALTVKEWEVQCWACWK